MLIRDLFLFFNLMTYQLLKLDLLLLIFLGHEAFCNHKWLMLGTRIFQVFYKGLLHL